MRRRNRSQSIHSANSTGHNETTSASSDADGKEEDTEEPGPAIGPDAQAYIPHNLNSKFHSDGDLATPYEICLWKSPQFSNEADRKRFFKNIDNFLKPLTLTQYANHRQLTEPQILGIMMVNRYNLSTTKSDLKHYESVVNDSERLTSEQINQLRDGIKTEGSDLYKISRKYSLPLNRIVPYYHRNYNASTNDHEKSLKELEYQYDKKIEREKKKSRKRGVPVLTRSSNVLQSEVRSSIIQSAPSTSDAMKYDVGVSLTVNDKTGDQNGTKIRATAS